MSLATLSSTLGCQENALLRAPNLPPLPEAVRRRLFTVHLTALGDSGSPPLYDMATLTRALARSRGLPEASAPSSSALNSSHLQAAAPRRVPQEGPEGYVQHALHGREDDLIAGQAAEGKAVLVSSHVLSEMERVCTRVCLISRGRVLARGSLDEVRSSAGRPVLRLRVRGAGDLVPLLEGALREAGLEVRLRTSGGVFEVDPIGGDGDVRSAAAVVLKRLLDVGRVPDLFEIHRPTLEEAFMGLVGGGERAGDLGSAR